MKAGSQRKRDALLSGITGRILRGLESEIMSMTLTIEAGAYDPELREYSIRLYRALVSGIKSVSDASRKWIK